MKKVETRHIYSHKDVQLSIPQDDKNATLMITNSGQVISLTKKELENLKYIFREYIYDENVSVE